MNTPDKPEVMRMARKLDLSRDDVVGKLVRLWAWFDSNSVDGVVDGVVGDDVDALAGIDGFASVMGEVGWLHCDDDAEQVTMPNFDAHNGESSKKRGLKSQRQAKWRAKSSAPETEGKKRSPIPITVKNKVMQKDGGICVYCGYNADKPAPVGEYIGAKITIDHIYPVSLGGDNNISNLVSCCSVCNGYKGNKTLDDCGLELAFASDETVKGYKQYLSTKTSTGASTKVSTNTSTREEKRREENIYRKFDFSDWPSIPSEQVLNDWFAMRKRQKADVSQTVINRLTNEFLKAKSLGYSVDDCLSECVTRNWRGFKAEWVSRDEPAPVGETRAGL